jgi:hypothetical protein
VGEVSYGDLSRVFDPGTGAVRAEVVPLFFSTMNLGLSHDLSRRHTLNTTFVAGYRGPLDHRGEGGLDEAELDGSFPTSYNFSGSVGDAYALTSRDRLSFDLRGGYLGSNDRGDTIETPGSDSVVFGSTMDWSRIISPSSTFGLTAGGGVNYAMELDEYSFIPNLVLSYVTRGRVGSQVWSSSLSGGLNGFLDEVAATFRAQGFASWNLSGQIGRRWSAGMSIYGATALDPEPLVPAQYESSLAVTLPFAYRVTDNSVVNFGLTGSMNAPHLLNVGELPSQGELTAYLGYRYHLGTGASRGSWLY